MEDGGMAEWLNAPVLKTVRVERLSGFESLFLRQVSSPRSNAPEGLQAGRTECSGTRNNVPDVLHSGDVHHDPFKAHAELQV